MSRHGCRQTSRRGARRAARRALGNAEYARRIGRATGVGEHRRACAGGDGSDRDVSWGCAVTALGATGATLLAVLRLRGLA